MAVAASAAPLSNVQDYASGSAAPLSNVQDHASSSAAPLSNAHDATLAAKLPQPLQHLATTPATITYGQKGATISLLCRANSQYVVEIWERSNHTANLIEYVLCATHLEEVALIVGLVQRKSRFDVQCYVTAWLSISFDNVTNDCKRFEGVYTAYLNALQEKYGEDAHLYVITKPAFYLHITKPEAALFAEVISSQVMTANNLQYPASAFPLISELSSLAVRAPQAL